MGTPPLGKVPESPRGYPWAVRGLFAGTWRLPAGYPRGTNGGTRGYGAGPPGGNPRVTRESSGGTCGYGTKEHPVSGYPVCQGVSHGYGTRKHPMTRGNLRVTRGSRGGPRVRYQAAPRGWIPMGPGGVTHAMGTVPTGTRGYQEVPARGCPGGKGRCQQVLGGIQHAMMLSSSPTPLRHRATAATLRKVQNLK